MKQIAFLTDVHLDEQFPIDNNVNSMENLKQVLNDLLEKRIEEIIFGGDIGDATSHSYFFDVLKPFGTKLILGNHDEFTEVVKNFNHKHERGELYYTSEDEYFKFIFLDSSSEAVSNEQLKWLKSELTTNKKLILFIHHPILEIDTPIDKLYPLKERERLKAALTALDKEVVIFCGHYHMNDEASFKNLKQFISQSLSYQIVKNADQLEIDNVNFGYRILKFGAEKIETEVVNFSTSQKLN